MANETNFADILDRAPTEPAKNKTMQRGSYITILQGVPRFDKSPQKQTEFYEFTHKFVSAGDDVDEEELKLALTDVETGNQRQLQDITMTSRLYITEPNKPRIDRFLSDCGYAFDGEQTRRNFIENTAGIQVGVFVKHTPFTNGSGVRAEIDSTFAVEE